MAAHYIASTDINVGGGIYRSMQSKYNKRHKVYADVAIDIIKKALPILKKELDLPEKLNIRVASIKGRISGWYVNGSNLAIIDYVRFSKRGILETLCHELVHAEQYKQGRLASKYDNGSYVQTWNGKPVHESYRNRPHEIEARERQVKLADKVVEVLGSKFLA